MTRSVGEESSVSEFPRLRFAFWQGNGRAPAQPLAAVLVLVIGNKSVAMLTRMAMKLDGVAEATADYRADSDYEHEHR